MQRVCEEVSSDTDIDELECKLDEVEGTVDDSQIKRCYPVDESQIKIFTQLSRRDIPVDAKTS